MTCLSIGSYPQDPIVVLGMGFISLSGLKSNHNQKVFGYSSDIHAIIVPVSMACQVGCYCNTESITG